MPTVPVAAPSPAESGPTVLVSPIGLSPLYQGFVIDPVAVQNLSLRLGSVVDAPHVTVEVAWSESELAGTYTLLVPDAFPPGEAIADAVAKGGPVDTSALQPLLASVGAYRAELGDRFDVRLMSFGIRLGLWDPTTGSRCFAPGAPQDQAGLRFSDCFECVHPRTGPERVCYEGDARPGSVTGSKNLLRMLESSLRPAP